MLILVSLDGHTIDKPKPKAHILMITSNHPQLECNFQPFTSLQLYFSKSKAHYHDFGEIWTYWKTATK
jgi:hypothetical protein